MLVVFPLGLLATSVVWDICRLTTDNSNWGLVAFWTILAGVVGGLLAALPGFIDWLSIPKQTRAHKVGLYHMVLNLAVVGLFAISLVARWNAPDGYPTAGAGRMIWGWIGVAVALISSWLGGELVQTLGISVQEDAHPNAPSPLQAGGHASETRPTKPARSEV